MVVEDSVVTAYGVIAGIVGLVTTFLVWQNRVLATKIEVNETNIEHLHEIIKELKEVIRRLENRLSSRRD